MTEEGMSDALPDVEPTESVEDTSQVEPEPSPEVDPEWLEAPDPTPEQAPPPPPPPPQPYQQPYQPQPQQVPPGYMQPPQDSNAILEQFLQNPNAVIQQQVQQQLNQYTGPMASRILEMEAQTRNYQNARANDAINRAKAEIGKGYNEVLNKDEAFRGNKDVRGRVENALKTMHTEAVHEARATGDYRKLDSFSNPMLFEMTLIAAKKLSGYKSTGAESMNTFGAAVETANPSVQGVDNVLDADTEAALARLGKGARDKYIANLEKYGDRMSFE